MEIYDRDVERRAYRFLAAQHGFDILRGGRLGRYFLVPLDASFADMTAIMDRGDGHRTMKEAAEAARPPSAASVSSVASTRRPPGGPGGKPNAWRVRI